MVSSLLPIPSCYNKQASSRRAFAASDSLHRRMPRVAVGMRGAYHWAFATTVLPYDSDTDGIIDQNAIWRHRGRTHSERKPRQLRRAISRILTRLAPFHLFETASPRAYLLSLRPLRRLLATKKRGGFIVEREKSRFDDRGLSSLPRFLFRPSVR